jgi:hypothetical protein
MPLIGRSRYVTLYPVDLSFPEQLARIRAISHSFRAANKWQTSSKKGTFNEWNDSCRGDSDRVGFHDCSPLHSPRHPLRFLPPTPFGIEQAASTRSLCQQLKQHSNRPLKDNQQNND